MRKAKFLIIVGIIAVLIFISKNPITSEYISKIEPVGKTVDAGVQLTKSGAKYVKGLAQDGFNALAEAMGYNSESVAVNDENFSAGIPNTEAFTLVRVIDGDSITIDNQGVEARVRLIGIDTPESVHEDESKNTIYGSYASDYTKSLLKDVSTVYLTYDDEETDQYGRILAYVWLEEPTDVFDISEIENKMLNYIIAADGYAVDKVYMPNDDYASYFEIAADDAKKNNLGLWQYEEYISLINED